MKSSRKALRDSKRADRALRFVFGQYDFLVQWWRKGGRKSWWAFFGVLATAIVVVWLWSIFGLPWERLWASFQYFGQCARRFVTGVDAINVMPDAPIAGSGFVDQVRGNIENFAFTFRAGSVAMTNPVAMLYSLADLGNNANSVMRIVVWIPYIPMFFLLFRTIVMEPKWEKDANGNDVQEKDGPTPATSAMRSAHFRVISPAFKAARAWWRWITAADVSHSDPNWREERRHTGIWFWWSWMLAGLIFSGLFMDVMDFCGFYFVFTRTLFKVSAFPLIVSFIVTVVDDIAKLGPFYDSLIAAYIAYRIGRKICVRGLTDKLDENIDKLSHMGVATLIMGPQGSGKTQMMWFMCYITASLMRSHALKIMMRYRYAFRLFDWRRLEIWVMKNSLRRRSGPSSLRRGSCLRRRNPWASAARYTTASTSRTS